MELFRRENYLKRIRGFYDADDIIKVITGVRRCGKSSLMQTIVDELRDRGVEDERIVYIDLDKRAYRKITTSDALEGLIDSFDVPDGLTYLFIDEVQNVDGFETLLNGYRNDGGRSIFITGSNSYLLSGEIATKLTGRFLQFELFTLDFEEYCQMMSFYGRVLSGDSQELLNRYVTDGGFPRAVFLEDPEDRREYVRGVVDEIFQKDIRKRVKVRDIAMFKAVQSYVINNFGATMSIKSLTEALGRNGIVTTRATVARYIQALVDAKILYEADRFDMKSKRSLSGEKKYYLSDLGFYFAANVDNRINYGPVLENIVYIYSRARGYAVSVGRIGRLECDFILRKRDMEYAYVQVAYTIMASKETEDREYRSLEAIQDNYPKYVMTTDSLLQRRNGIRHVNLVSFMRNGEMF